MKKIYQFVLFLLFINSTRLVSQQISTSQTQEISSTHFYTFEGKASQEKLDELEQILAKMEFVVQAKVKYKAEKEMGQVIMTVKQPVVVRENQKEFSPTRIKKTLISLGFSPIEYTKGESR